MNVLASLRNTLHRLRKNWWGVVIGILLAVVTGLFVLHPAYGQRLINLSYDALFPIRGTIPVSEAALVYIDEDSHTYLNQSWYKPWNRELHTELLRRLTREKARAVIYDIVFSGATPTEEEPTGERDKRFAEALRENGKAILAAELVYVPPTDTVGETRRIDPPYDLFYQAVGERHIGLDNVYPDADLALRKYLPASDKVDVPSEAWVAAQLLQLPIAQDTNRQYQPFWINYYGPGGTIPGVSFYQAITNEANGGLPEGYFSNKVVFIGGKFKTKMFGDRKDEYSTPFSSLSGVDSYQRFVCGVEIHANAFMNLLRGDCLFRFERPVESAVILLLGILLGAGLVLCRPALAITLAIAAAVLVTGIAYALFVGCNRWFPWAVVVVAQIPIALVWSVTFNSVQLYVQNRLLEQSLAAYLSPKRVKQLMAQQGTNQSLLAPGAEKQTLTILFSDIESFTVLSEGVDSDELAGLMNKYFENAVSNCVFKTDGTVVKYIGDAIFAFWNAPEQQSDHAARACEAGLLLAEQAIVHEKHGKNQRFRTRVGLHTGVANVGNFGSSTRIDYTAIGENINLASRMEGLNKYLGTSALITGDTKAEMGDRLITRYCGKFVLKGFEKAVEVHELVGKLEVGETTKSWREAFDRALQAFFNKDLAEAERGFRCVLEIRPADGPSKFYLREIEALAVNPPNAGWQGEIELKDK